MIILLEKEKLTRDRPKIYNFYAGISERKEIGLGYYQKHDPVNPRDFVAAKTHNLVQLIRGFDVLSYLPNLGETSLQASLAIATQDVDTSQPIRGLNLPLEQIFHSQLPNLDGMIEKMREQGLTPEGRSLQLEIDRGTLVSTTAVEQAIDIYKSFYLAYHLNPDYFQANTDPERYEARAAHFMSKMQAVLPEVRRLHDRATAVSLAARNTNDRLLKKYSNSLLREFNTIHRSGDEINQMIGYMGGLVRINYYSKEIAQRASTIDHPEANRALGLAMVISRRLNASLDRHMPDIYDIRYQIMVQSSSF